MEAFYTPSVFLFVLRVPDACSVDAMDHFFKTAVFVLLIVEFLSFSSGGVC